MSPTVFKERGYRFFFFSREEERMHVHVVSGDGEAKYWLTSPQGQALHLTRNNVVRSCFLHSQPRGFTYDVCTQITI
jgi:hypothetical protein